MKRTQAKRLADGAGGDGYPLAAVQKIGKALASDDSRIDPSRFRLSARPLWALIFATTLLLCAGISTDAEVNQDGDLIVSFDGGLSPTKLPRRALAPVAVRVAGNVKSATGNEDSLPQLRKISVAINRQGHLFDHGLPVCQVSAPTECAASPRSRPCPACQYRGSPPAVESRRARRPRPGR